MTHLEVENLASDFLEEALDAVRKAQVEEHLAACAPCREVVEEVRSAIQMCHAAEEVLPPPWLIPRIRRATLGEKRPSLFEQIAALQRMFRQPRFVYGIAMVVFSISVVVNASGLRLRNLSLEDLSPATWYNQANRAGHLIYAHAEKFYYDLRIVYEIESRFRDVRTEQDLPQAQPEKPKTAPERPASTTGAQHVTLAYEKLSAAESDHSGTSRSRIP
jgi:Putative zinc-finger